MKIWSDSTGSIVEFDLVGGYAPTNSYPRMLEMDAETNQVLVLEMRADWSRFRLTVLNRLTRDGQFVTIAPDGPALLDRRLLRAVWLKLRDGVALTDEERDLALRVLVREAILERLDALGQAQRKEII